MKKMYSDMRDTIAHLKHRLAAAERELAECIKNCPHEWSTPVADHIYTPGYTIPGDPPGTMGVDWRGPCYAEAKTQKRWKRQCRICGEVQFTSKTTQHVTESPHFG